MTKLIKRSLVLLLTFILVMGLSSCNNIKGTSMSEAEKPQTNSVPPKEDGDTGNRPLSVVTTIFPPYDFSREIAGDNVKLKMLLPPGAESHSFEPTPQDIITIQSCDVFIYTGGESESWVDSILTSMDTSQIKVLRMIDMVQALDEEVVDGMEVETDDELDHEEKEYDEHVWTSPVNAQLIVGGISDVFQEIDPQNAEFYKSNTEAYVKGLKELDSEFRAVVDNAARHTMIFGDRFPFLYFAKEYGLDYYAAFPGCSTDTEPSVATVAFLIDKIVGEEIPVVFQIEFSTGKMADAITDSTGAKKLLLHSCHNVSKEDIAAGVNYLDLMRQNVINLKEALN